MSPALAETKEVGGVVLRRDPAREPCFTVVHTDAEMKEWPDMSDVSRRERLHRHMNIEVGAMEIAAQSLVDFPDTDWDVRMSLARQVADESRHTLLLLRRLSELGGFKGEFPIANFEWGVTLMLEDLVGRLAVQNRTFEAGLIDILGTMGKRWRDEAGDQATTEILESILADEITHVRFANRWIRRMTQQDPRNLFKVARAMSFLARVNEQLAPKPGDLNAVGIAWTEERRLPPVVNVEDRKEADFTEDEIAEVLRQAGYRSLVALKTED
jgi:uncharacterized ferritin-like protein (DUF455 family)